MLLDDPTCCEDTVAELSKQECILSVLKKQNFIIRTLDNLVRNPQNSTCSGTAASREWFCWPAVEIFGSYSSLTACREANKPFVTPPACTKKKRRPKKSNKKKNKKRFNRTASCRQKKIRSNKSNKKKSKADLLKLHQQDYHH